MTNRYNQLINVSKRYISYLEKEGDKYRTICHKFKKMLTENGIDIDGPISEANVKPGFFAMGHACVSVEGSSLSPSHAGDAPASDEGCLRLKS